MKIGGNWDTIICKREWIDEFAVRKFAYKNLCFKMAISLMLFIFKKSPIKVGKVKH